MSHAHSNELAHNEQLAVVAPAARDSHVRTRRPRLHVEASGNTDIGLVRETNEDCIAVLPEIGLFMVADGMGGAAAGEVASRLTIDAVREAFELGDVTRPIVGDERSYQLPDTQLLIDAILRAHTHISGISRRDAAKRGMGTTFAGLLVLEDRLVIAHVGDSRVYRLRGNRLELLTEDHSLLNKLIQEGAWSPAEADAFPWPNAISQAVGALEQDGTPMRLEVATRDDVPHPGDVFLICSDGLHGMLDHRQIETILRRNVDLTLAVQRLIELANDHGGQDNITAVLVRVADPNAR